MSAYSLEVVRTIAHAALAILVAIFVTLILIGSNQAHATGDPQHCNARADITSYYMLQPNVTDPALVYQFSGDDALKLTAVWAAQLGPLPSFDDTPTAVAANVFVGFDTLTGDTDWFFYDVDGCYDVDVPNVAVPDTEVVFATAGVSLNLDATKLPGTAGGPAGFLVTGGRGL